MRIVVLRRIMGGLVTEATLDDTHLPPPDRTPFLDATTTIATAAPGSPTGSDYELRVEPSPPVGGEAAQPNSTRRDDPTPGGGGVSVARFGEADLPEAVRLVIAWVDGHPATVTRLVR